MKDTGLNQDPLHVTDPEVARVLADTREWAVLSVFLDETTLSGLQKNLG
jgi:hypothetical protein